MKPFNYRSISSDWTKMKPDLAASCPWCSIIYPHNWISHQASHLIVFFWLMKVLWASFICLSSHWGWKFQQKTCHSLAPAIPCWSEGQTTPLKMINTELIFLLIISIESTQKFELKLGKPDLARVVVFVLLRFVCCIYVCDFSQFFIRCQSLSMDYVMDSRLTGASCITLNQLSVLTYM